MELFFWHMKQVQSKEPNFYGEFLIATPPLSPNPNDLAI